MESLNNLLLKELKEIVKGIGLDIESKSKKNEIIEAIINHYESLEGHTIAWGTLDVMMDGYGFLRETSVEKDIYVSASQVRRFKLRSGDMVLGEVRTPLGDEKNYAIRKVLLINGGDIAIEPVHWQTTR